MKRLLIISGVLSCLLLLALSCSKEGENGGGRVPPEPGRENNDSVMIHLRISGASSAAGVSSKGMTVQPNRVDDINLYIFDAGGDAIVHRYISGGGLSIPGTKVKRGETCYIYLLANAGRSLPVRRKSEMLQLKITAGEISQIVSSQGTVVMTGSKGPVVPDEETTVEMELVKTVARFVVRSNLSNLSPDVSISVKRVSLKQAPSALTPFSTNRASVGEVIDGESFTLPDDLAGISGEGIAFLLWENMQGVVAPDATDNKSKESFMAEASKGLCSYIEMVYDYSSPQKRGEIIYRFYLGVGFTDCNVERNRQYLCTVYFNGNGSADENSWSVDTSLLSDIPQGPADVAFEESERILYCGETAVLRYSKVSPISAVPQVELSDESVLEIVEATSMYVKVRSLANGSCAVTAKNGEALASCNVRVEEARISLPDAVTLYKALPKQVSYTILPESAKGLPLELLISSAGISGTLVEGESKIELVGTQAGAAERMVLRFKEMPDLSAASEITVKPTISMRESEVNVVVNRGTENTVTPLEIDTDPDYRDRLEYSWSSVGGASGPGAENCTVDLENGRLLFSNPNSANGGYLLTVGIAGDMGDKASLEVNIYEMVYIIAYSRTLSSETLEERRTSINVEYNNEIKVRWFSNPRSILFNGREELYNLCNYSFRGVNYTAADADNYLYENILLTFNDGLDYPMVDGTTFKFNIKKPDIYPEMYEAYYQVQPASGEEYLRLPSGEYVHIWSITFANGLADKEHDWREVFRYKYPY